MTEEQADRLERKLDLVIEHLPALNALGKLLVRQTEATELIGLSKNTIQKNDNIDKYEEVGHRRTFVMFKDLSVVKRRR